ncbi:ankyrin repeat domain-containing protein [Tenacibaculum geojense]|uniref:Ankyrin repeat domain-containing protein n=1 Tax=Tenacibaculum geojense TaxID=915352 RepID=A0ABW3JQP2_9FLAO
MKKVVLSILVLAAVTFSATANTITENSTNYETNYVKVSPFCKLIQSGNYDAVKAMIENGENVNKKSGGLTPLMFAARYNQSKIASLLIENGAKIKVKSDYGRTALDWAKLAKAHDTHTVIQKALKS